MLALPLLLPSHYCIHTLTPRDLNMVESSSLVSARNFGMVTMVLAGRPDLWGVKGCGEIGSRQRNKQLAGPQKHV